MAKKKAAKRQPRTGETGINGYLVLLRHTMDDLPLRFFGENEYAKAKQFARSRGEMPTPHIRAVYNTDCSTPVGVDVVRFSNGVPVDVEMVVDFTQ